MKRLLLLFCSLLVTLGAGELIVQKLKPQLTYSAAYKGVFDCLTHDVLIPFTLKKNHTCTMKDYWGDFDTKATTNSMGYRGREFSQKPKEGTTRILMLGDSFTFGYGVTDDETYPVLLEKSLQEKAVEVINAGYADGYSPDSYYVYLKNRGFSLNPSIIVMSFFVYNDLFDLAETVWEKTSADGLPETIVSCCRYFEGGKLRNKDLAVKYKIPVLRQSHLFLLAMNEYSSRYRPQENTRLGEFKYNFLPGCPLSPECIEKFAREEQRVYTVINAMKRGADERNIPFIILMIPIDYQLVPEVIRKYGSIIPLDPQNPDFIQKRLSANFSDRNIPTIDLYGIFQKDPDPKSLYFPSDAHFTPRGNALTASVLAEYLTSHGYIE